jgi:hypothetical protein
MLFSHKLYSEVVHPGCTGAGLPCGPHPPAGQVMRSDAQLGSLMQEMVQVPCTGVVSRHKVTCMLSDATCVATANATACTYD